MKVVSTEELINHKILPYNIYSQFGEKLFAAGEVLTPGKLLQLRHMDVLYRDEETEKGSSTNKAPAKEQSAEKPMISSRTQQPQVQSKSATAQEDSKEAAQYEPQEQPIEKPMKVVIETFDMNPAKMVKDKLSVDDIDILSYRGPINKKSKIEPQTQIKIKAFYNKILEMMIDVPPVKMVGMFANVRDKIVQDIIFDSDDALFCSQIKLLGEYDKCHALNAAILSGAVAKKMGLGENVIFDVVLAGLLHDIGKTRVPKDLLVKANLTYQQQKMIQDHTKIGYKIIKQEMDLPENIAKVALEHHEHNDGSGYPNGVSGERINIETQIVSVSSYFDDLAFNKTPHKIKNTKEALRVMLGTGTQRFSAKALYTLIHMFSYNDTVSFEEMVL